MLEDIKFDLQTLAYRPLGQTEWAEFNLRRCEIHSAVYRHDPGGFRQSAHAPRQA
jgi:hypothetical protein